MRVYSKEVLLVGRYVTSFIFTVGAVIMGVSYSMEVLLVDRCAASIYHLLCGHSHHGSVQLKGGLPNGQSTSKRFPGGQILCWYSHHGGVLSEQVLLMSRYLVGSNCK
jgi:hypothetical protein